MTITERSPADMAGWCWERAEKSIEAFADARWRSVEDRGNGWHRLIRADADIGHYVKLPCGSTITLDAEGRIEQLARFRQSGDTDWRVRR